MSLVMERGSAGTDRSTIARPMDATSVRSGAVALAASRILFVLYPSLRPFSDEASLNGAEAFASTAWILAHTLAILGFILLVWGMFNLYVILHRTRAEHFVLWGLGLSWLGVGLTLPFYGAEVFGLHAIGQAAVQQQNAALLDLANQIRSDPASRSLSWVFSRSPWAQSLSQWPSGDRTACPNGAAFHSRSVLLSTSHSTWRRSRSASPMVC